MTTKREFSSRWGNPIADDYQWCHVPGYILRNYSKCVSAVAITDDDGNTVTRVGEVVGVDMQDMMFVVHIMAFKYDTPDAKAMPSLKTIAEYTGLSINSVRRIKQRLIDYGLLTVATVPGYPDLYNFAGLHDQCMRLESGLAPIEGVEVYTPPKNGSTPKFGSTTPPKNGSTPLPKMGGEELSMEKGKKKNNSDAVQIQIKAWLDGLIATPATNQYGNKTNRAIAKALHENGILPEQVTQYVQILSTDPYWKGKLISYSYVGNNIAAWLTLQAKPIPPVSAAAPLPAEAAPALTPEQAAERVAEYKRIMAELNDAIVDKVA